MLFSILLALLNGALIGTSRAINGQLSTRKGAFGASVWNHVVGFVFLTAVLLVLHTWPDASDVPLAAYVGGVFGALFVAVNSYVFPRLGAMNAAVLVISGQVLSAVAIDCVQQRSLPAPVRLAGVALVLLGLCLPRLTSQRGKKGDPALSERELIDDLLDDRTYHIEFNGHLTNHAKHAVVALAGLGVPARDIKAYYDDYAKLTSYGYGLEPPKPDRHTITEENWRRHLGQRTSFWSYCDFFDQRERELGLDEVLRRYVPELLPGWTGAFTHATIHLGWALDVGHRWMAIEGLAYMAFSYATCHPERALPSTGKDASPADSLLRLAAEWEERRDELAHWVAETLADTSPVDRGEIHPELLRSGLQFRIARTLSEGHPLFYDTPAWVEGSDDVWEPLYYAVTLLYLSQPADFVLLHLITSLHAMEQIALRLPEDVRRDAVRCFWIGLLGTVFSGGGFPRRAKLAALHELFAHAVDGGSKEEDWSTIVSRAVIEEEEHNPKLVHVLRRVWARSGRRAVFRVAAGQFTATPDLPPSFEEPPTA
ncbi:questin oxidase family protein [Nonomuraea sp. CA-141351]|uniref:questin oxidase family protein n=1 Tax=Nonomuraea sp. CA-141351 TaxID=3239996 RepID=UPI003D89B370